MQERVDVAGALISWHLAGRQGDVTNFLPRWDGDGRQDVDEMWAGLLALKDRKAVEP